MAIEAGLKPQLGIGLTRREETEAHDPTPHSLRIVRPRRWAYTMAALMILLLAGVIAGLIFIPWQQSVRGSGEVIIFNPADRPQTIEAQITARLVGWNVQEGQTVQKGQIIAVLQDIDPRYLDPGLLRRMNEQRQRLKERLDAAMKRDSSLAAQIVALQDSRSVQVPGAEERAKQAINRMNAANKAVQAAQQSLKAAEKVAKAAADERYIQAKQAVEQAEQAQTAVEQRVSISQKNYDRVVYLERRGLRSTRDKEVAEQELNVLKTDLERAKNAVEIANRNVNIGGLQQTQAELDVVRARAELGRVMAVYEEATRGVRVGDFDAERVKADTIATVSSAEASRNQVQTEIASINNEILRLEVDYNNVQQRVQQTKVIAPRTGRIVRVLKVGPGETVKQGDVLAEIAPDTQEQMVELYVSDTDIPFIFVGAPARLQFAGWPAVTWVGFPSAAVGTFAGRVKLVDAFSDGKGKYRVVVEPDYKAIQSGKEQAWPQPNPLRPGDAMTMRPGAAVNGWVMLRQVRLGFELWRQLNAFPPSVDSYTAKYDKDKGKGGDDDEKKEDKVKRKVKLK